jgi:hypothetical protein
MQSTRFLPRATKKSPSSPGLAASATKPHHRLEIDAKDAYSKDLHLPSAGNRAHRLLPSPPRLVGRDRRTQQHLFIVWLANEEESWRQNTH